MFYAIRYSVEKILFQATVSVNFICNQRDEVNKIEKQGLINTS